jgi:hypothetical protein
MGAVKGVNSVLFKALVIILEQVPKRVKVAHKVGAVRGVGLARVFVRLGKFVVNLKGQVPDFVSYYSVLESKG